MTEDRGHGRPDLVTHVGKKLVLELTQPLQFRVGPLELDALISNRLAILDFRRQVAENAKEETLRVTSRIVVIVKQRDVAARVDVVQIHLEWNEGTV